MPDLRDALDREGMHFDLAPGALDRLFERRRRRQRRAKIVTTAVTVAIVVGVMVALASLRDLGGTSRTPVQQPTVTAPSGDPLTGTWESVPLGRIEVVRAFVAAGGTEAEGRAFFDQLGGGATRDAVVTLRFQDGAFVEFESGDGNAPIMGFEATYQVSGDQLTIESPRCTGTYAFSTDGGALRLRPIHQCQRHDGVYNTTLFTSWPLYEQG